MKQFSGTVKFVSSDKAKAVVSAATVGDSGHKSLKLVMGNFSTKAKGNPIVFEYAPNAGAYAVTVIS